MNVFLIGAGAFYTVEAATNLLYWNESKQPDNGIWQIGRVLRGLIGIALVGVGLLG